MSLLALLVSKMVIFVKIGLTKCDHFSVMSVKVDVLRNAKIKLSQELQEKKAANEMIEEELDSTNKKLEMNRITIRVSYLFFLSQGSYGFWKVLS